MAQTGYGFIIVGAQTEDGRTLMVASQCVRDVEINQTRRLRNAPMGRRQACGVVGAGDEDRRLTSPGRSADGAFKVDQGGYAEAWRRLFDVWVPPQFTDETRSQILTHYTFGGMP